MAETLQIPKGWKLAPDQEQYVQPSPEPLAPIPTGWKVLSQEQASPLVAHPVTGYTPDQQQQGAQWAAALKNQAEWEQSKKRVPGSIWPSLLPEPKTQQPSDGGVVHSGKQWYKPGAKGWEIAPLGTSERTLRSLGFLPEEEHRAATQIKSINQAIEFEKKYPDVEWEEWLLKRVPFARAAPETLENVAPILAAERMEKGEGTSDDYRQVAKFILRMERMGQRGVAKRLFDAATELPAWGIEIGTTAGAYTAGRGILKTGGKMMLTRLMKGAAARALGVAAQTAANPQLVASQISEQVVKRLDINKDQKGEITATLNHDDGGFVMALKGLAGAATQIGSEKSGEFLLKGLGKLIPGSKKLAGLKAAVISRYLAKPGATITAMNNLLKQAGWHGLIGESLEERVGENIQGALGVSDFGATGDIIGGAVQLDPARIAKGLTQIAEEAAIFSIPGAINVAPAIADKMRKGWAPSVEEVMSLGATPEQAKNRKSRKQFMKEMEDAISQREAEAVPVGEAPGDSQAVGPEVREQGGEEQAPEVQVTPPTEPSVAPPPAEAPKAAPTPPAAPPAPKPTPTPKAAPEAVAKPTKPSRPLYRETSLQSVLEFLPNPPVIVGYPYGPPDVFLSDKPELALGQGANKGVVLEFEGGGIDAREHVKPGTQVPGVGKEYTVRATPGSLSGNLVAITIKRDAKSDKVTSIVFRRSMKQLGWDKTENADGSVTWRRPGTQEAPTAPTKPKVDAELQVALDNFQQQYKDADPTQKKTWQFWEQEAQLANVTPENRKRFLNVWGEGGVHGPKKQAPAAAPSAKEPLSNYASWKNPELAAEAKKRGLKGVAGKNKAALQKMLEDDDASKREPKKETPPPKRRGGPKATVPTSPLPSGKQTRSTGEVVSELSKAFGVPIRTGHFRGGPERAGIYKNLEEVARIKGYGDIAVSAHEVAHHIDKTTNLLTNLPANLSAELSSLDYDPTRGDIHEGFAEYVRHRLTTDEASIVAPAFDGWFTNWLSTNPVLADAFQSSRATVDQWRGAGAIERVKAQIHMGESAWTRVSRVLRPKTVWDWIADNWINRLRPLLKVSKEMTGAGSTADLIGRMPGDINFWAFAKVSNMAAAAKARGWAHYGTADAAGNKVGAGLKETFSPIAKDLRDSNKLLDFYAYAYARHASTLYDQYDAALQQWRAGGQVGPAPRLKNPGISRSDALATIAEFDSNPGWQQAAKGLTSWHNDLIDYLVDAGGLSKDAADAMKAMYPNYISLARNIDSDFAPGAAGGGSRYANLPKAVRRLKGSGREILPPLESALAYAERIIGLADKIRVSKMLVDAAKQYGFLGDVMEKVDPRDVATSVRLGNLKKQLEDAGADLSSADMDALLTTFSQEFTGDAKDNILVLYEDGKPQLYYVRPDVYRALMAYDKPARLPAVIDQTFGRVARAIRLGTTGLKPGFSLLTNPLRDLPASLLQTEYQPRNPFSIAVNAGRGLVEAITKSDIAQMWERGGGPMAQPLGVDRKFLKETIQDLLATTPSSQVLDWMHHPVDSLRTLFSLPESAPRLAEFRAALNKMGWSRGQKVTFEQYVKSQLAAANVTVDFREGGTLGMWVNQLVPFFNASIQGPHRMASSLRNHPVSTVGVGLLWMTLPTLALWWRQKDEEWYKNLTPMERYRYWHVRIPGTDHIIRLPKPFEWGHIFGSMPESALQSMFDKDPQAITESASTLLADTSPSILPGLLEAPIEVIANKDLYFDKPLVPERLKGLEPKDQYNPYTTEAAKAVGALLGVSPIYVEHLVSGWTGGLATQATGTVESIVGVTGRKTQRSLTGGPSALPVVGRLFLSPLHTRQFDDFYTQLEKLEQKHASLKLRGGSDLSIITLRFMRDQSDDLAKLRTESREVLADTELSDNDKRERFIEIHKKMLQIATETNETIRSGEPVTDDIKTRLNEKRGEIVKDAFHKPDRKEYKSDETYQKSLESRDQNLQYLQTMKDQGVSFTQAVDYLTAHYQSGDETEFEGDKKSGAFKKRYKSSATALAEMYGKTYQDFLDWHKSLKP